jgi:Tfp pilus assembly protein PilO
LNTLGQLARREQVVLVVLKPTSDINKITPGPSGYLELQIFVVVSGGYHQIGKFLDTVESSSELLVRVQEFGIADDDESLWTHGGYILFQAYLAPGAAKQAGAG